MKITEEHVQLALGAASADLPHLEDTLWQLGKDSNFAHVFAEVLEWTKLVLLTPNKEDALGEA